MKFVEWKKWINWLENKWRSLTFQVIINVNTSSCNRHFHFSNQSNRRKKREGSTPNIFRSFYISFSSCGEFQPENVHKIGIFVSKNYMSTILHYYKFLRYRNIYFIYIFLFYIYCSSPIIIFFEKKSLIVIKIFNYITNIFGKITLKNFKRTKF